MDKLVGQIIKVTYYNDTNGFAFVKVKIDFNEEVNEYLGSILTSDAITVGGTFNRMPLPEEEYLFEGDFVETKYGLQLKAKTINQEKKDTKNAICTYLSGPNFEGIGRKIAEKVYDALGKDALNIILTDKNSLDKVDLTKKQKDIIYSGVSCNYENEKNIISFINMGFTLQMANRIVRSIDDKIIKKAVINPYLLIGRVSGIGFLRADKIALNMGIKPNNKTRLEACIIYLLTEYIRSSGNTYIEKEKLKELAFEFLNKNSNEVISDSDFEGILEKLSVNKKIYCDNDLDSKNIKIYDTFIYNCELELSKCIINILNEELTNISDEEINEKIGFISKLNHITYSKIQEKAILKALKNNITIITGGPGTGKTTIVKGIIDIYRLLYKDIPSQYVALLAPTGRAARRLSDVTGHPASTIHSYLGFDGSFYEYNSKNKQLAKLVIIDEFSMVDVEMAYRLFSSLDAKTKFVLVGDSDQIPSVGPGEVLANLIKTKEIDTIKLDKIHRQAENSTIINLAHKLNNGIIPSDILEKKHDRTYLPVLKLDIPSSIVKVMESAVSKGMDIIKDIQVLIPKYKGEVGIDNINRILQDKFNPLKDQDKEFIFGVKRFRIGDKVIQLVNRKDEQIMNGDIGYVVSFSYANGNVSEMLVAFDEKKVSYTPDDLEQINLGYAISIHKSQGSEFKTVIIPLSTEYYIMLKRKLYYTAITRAKEYLILIGDIKALDIACKTIGEERKTRLYDYIIDNFNKNASDKTLTPFDFLDDNCYNISEFDLPIDEDE